MPVLKGYSYYAFRKSKILPIIKGPLNWSKFEKAAKNPPRKNVMPIYFLKDLSSLPSLVSSIE